MKGLLSLGLAIAACLVFAQDMLTIGLFELTVPKGWTYTRQKANLMLTSPTGRKEGQITLHCLPDTPDNGKPKECQKLAWKSLGGQKFEGDQAVNQQDGGKVYITFGPVKVQGAKGYGMLMSYSKGSRFQSFLAVGKTKLIVENNQPAIQTVLGRLKPIAP
jgi:hypothetical protein